MSSVYYIFLIILTVSLIPVLIALTEIELAVQVEGLVSFFLVYLCLVGWSLGYAQRRIMWLL